MFLDYLADALLSSIVFFLLVFPTILRQLCRRVQAVCLSSNDLLCLIPSKISQLGVCKNLYPSRLYSLLERLYKSQYFNKEVM